MMGYIASIDIGSHTARLLIAERTGQPGFFRPVVRKRATIRLAEAFRDHEPGTIKADAVARTLEALEEFASILRRHGVQAILAVATGVVREAANKDRFLGLIYDRTGIRVDLISGEEEARLTGKGVLHALHIDGGSFLIFDLGGGSTEFLLGGNGNVRAESLPLGAMILTKAYMHSDPPGETHIRGLAAYVDQVLHDVFSDDPRRVVDGHLVGTGGTVTTLAAMMYGVDTEQISPERLNGLTLKAGGLQDVFERMSTMALEERLTLPGLDRGRADVILAGTLAVMRIMHFFKAPEMLVSLSDLLEGRLIAYLEGGENEETGH